MVNSTPETSHTPSTPLTVPTANPWARILKYTLVRGGTLFLMVTISVFLIIFIANLGGYVDEIMRSNIADGIGERLHAGWLRELPTEEKFTIVEQTQWEAEEAMGLHKPFLGRCVRWLYQGVTLNWGKSRARLLMSSGVPAQSVRNLIADALPRTLLLFGTANLLLFFASLGLGLFLTRRYGSWLDRLVMTCSPLSAAPSWVYGLFLQVILVKFIGYSLGGQFDAWPSEFKLTYLPYMVKYMALPILALFLSKFFQTVYTCRTFFLIHYTEDYVEMAKAQGLRHRTIERKYILRPALPYFLTSFALLLIGLWQEAILLEPFFNVAGIGQLFFSAIYQFDIPLIVGIVTLFAYLLALTVFLLDIVYAVVDPRVQIGGSHTVGKSAGRRALRLPFVGRRSQRRPARRPGAPEPRPAFSLTFSIVAWGQKLRRTLAQGPAFWRELVRYPSAVVGLTLILALVGVSLYTVIAFPYEQTIKRWQNQQAWDDNPINALPAWVNYFLKDDLPPTIILNSRNGTAAKTAAPVSSEMTEIKLVFPIDYSYSESPQDFVINFSAQFHEKRPFLSLTWVTPDGREIKLGDFSVLSAYTYHLFDDERLAKRLAGAPRQALFSPSDIATDSPLKGRYELRISGLVFEPEADLDAELVLYGRVYGLAGTNGGRRDVLVGLLWGAPIALAFGLLAAVGTTCSTMLIAAVGAWFGGWVDELIQRLNEINLLLPVFPVSLMIYLLYSKSIWVILSVTVLLNVFGNGVKNYRAVFLQVKNAPYIEAAQAYGTPGGRLIFHYLIPRIGTVIIPQLIVLVPNFVFLESSLSILGLSDPHLPPTWGQLILEGFSYSIYHGAYHMTIEPAVLLMLTGLAFLLVGIALERALDPRLRNR